LKRAPDFPADHLIPDDLAYSAFGLPAKRHIPGSGSEPDLEFLQSIKQQCPENIATDQWRGNLVYRYGWHLFTHQFYWESHEIWEAVWLRCHANSRQRFLLQALIQIANARLKIMQNKNTVAQKILLHATALGEEAFSGRNRHQVLMGVSHILLSELVAE